VISTCVAPGATCTARSTVALPGYKVTLWIGASAATADAAATNAAAATVPFCLNAIDFLSGLNPPSLSNGDAGKAAKCNNVNHHLLATLLLYNFSGDKSRSNQ